MITGATTGVGRATARVFAVAGAHLGLTARHEAAVDEVAALRATRTRTHGQNSGSKIGCDDSATGNKRRNGLFAMQRKERRMP